ncbi:RICIN domain-containing protein [Streptomyces sp. DSM 110735]|nr:RICIN domain-containing protein [Streptomyces sp. DSM 110735]
MVNPRSGRCLDDPAGSTADGTRLQIHDRNGTAAQRWTPAA